MNIQTVTSTYAQRNFGKLLKLRGPIAIMRDSQPEAVLVDYQEYLRMREFEKEQLRLEFKQALARMQAQNKQLDEKNLDNLIKEALHAAGRD